jgi:hypothetical protein
MTNKEQVLLILRKEGMLTIKEIQEKTGLGIPAKNAVSELVKEKKIIRVPGDSSNSLGLYKIIDRTPTMPQEASVESQKTFYTFEVGGKLTAPYESLEEALKHIPEIHEQTSYSVYKVTAVGIVHVTTSFKEY